MFHDTCGLTSKHTLHDTCGLTSKHTLHDICGLTRRHMLHDICGLTRRHMLHDTCGLTGRHTLHDTYVSFLIHLYLTFEQYISTQAVAMRKNKYEHLQCHCLVSIFLIYLSFLSIGLLDEPKNRNAEIMNFTPETTT